MMTTNRAANDTAAARGAERLGGGLLALTAVLSLILVMHHPSLGAHHGVGEFAAGVCAVGAMDRMVHGSLMVVLGVQALGFCIFAARLGFRRPAVTAGCIAFAIGVVGMIIPTTLDGFVTPDLAQACLAAPGGCNGAELGTWRLVAAMIQDFTKVALTAMAMATGCWALALLLRKGAASRAAGAIGVVSAAISLAVLFSPGLQLRPANLAEVIAAQMAWTLAAAAWILIDRPADPGQAH